MRLLDHVAQCTAPFMVRQQDGGVWRLTGAADFAPQVARCPLRYVLTDELVQVCVELAYSEGDELSGCLDLLHLPAEQLWIEWDERARCAALARMLPECVPPGQLSAVRGAVLMSADPGGRAGSLRTFRLAAGERPEPLVAALETLLDLDGGVVSAPAEELLNGAAVCVNDPSSVPVDRLLGCARFRFDPTWRGYYCRTAHSVTAQAQVIHNCLAVVAFDIPMLLALFLLMNLRTGMPQTAIQPGRLNAKRARLGKPPLLEHIEVSSPVFATATAGQPRSTAAMLRSGPRLHSVRGHIVRRYNTVFWRRPHWRGHVRLGSVRSRTVELRLS